MIGDLLEDEDIIDAVKRIKRYGVNGVKLLLPQKLNAKIIFGFEDPYYTGKVLGWTAALIPIYGDHINITPDFEKRILKGELKIKGRIRRYKILYLLWKVYKDKDELIKSLQRIVTCAKKLNKIIVATGDVHFLDVKDRIFRDVFISNPTIGIGH